MNKPLQRFKGLEAFHDIDVRSYRGQVAAPGTPHRNGAYYYWDCNELYRSLGKPNRVTDLPEAPAWLLSALGGLMSWEPSPSAQVQGKPSEMSSYGKGSLFLQPESNAWYLKTIRDRWPITRAGQRNCLQAKPVTYLIAKSVSSDRVREIMVEWLNGYDGAFDSSLEEAIRELDDCIHRTQRDFEAGKIECMSDHSSKVSTLEIHTTLERFLKSNVELRNLLNTEAEKHSNELSVSLRLGELTGTTANRPLQFVLALMVHYQYRVAEFGETDTIRMTHLQLQEILEKRFSLKIHRKQLYRLADQFISRKNQDGKEVRASVFELLTQTKRGYTGTPSEYRVTGLPQLS